MNIEILLIFFGLVASCIAIYSVIPYIRSIVKKKTKPHQFSWIIYSIMFFVCTLSQILEGGNWSVTVPAILFFFGITVVVLSFKYGIRDSSSFDRLLFVLSLMLVSIWIFTKNNVVAIWLSVLVDMFATSMILLKVKNKPYSEDVRYWIFAGVAYIFSCLSLIGTPFGVLFIRPIYGLISDSIIVAVIFYYRIKFAKALSTNKDDLIAVE